MNAYAGRFFEWLLRASWQGAVLVLVVMAAQWMFRDKLAARWRHALWLLVVARLLMPALPQSPLSLFNFAMPERLRETSREPAVEVGWVPVSPTVVNTPAKQPGPFEMPNAATQIASSESHLITAQPSSTTAAMAANGSPALFSRRSMARWAALIWTAGAAFLALRIIVQSLRFLRRLRSAKPVTDAQTLALLDQCKERLGIPLSVGLVETNSVSSPALHGFSRPCLLLPSQMIGAFSQEELRYIFLHELAHVKRRDMALHWLVEALKIMHWFNPILWLGFRRMAAERELACDELALTQAGERECKPYGAAIIKVLENCSTSPALPGVVGLLEDRNQMARRISMILRFRAGSGRPLFAILLLALLAVITLTDARSRPEPASDAAASRRVPSSLTPKPEDIAPELAPADADNAPHPDLKGTVLAEDGTPLRATVFIYTAGPKVGSSTFCPSCYADCRKRATADARGHFMIESLDPQLLFRVLVVAKGYDPKFVSKVDAAKGLLDVKLKPSDRASVGPTQMLRGRVVDEKGNAVEGAVVNFHGIHRGGGGSWGQVEGVDPLAVTDEKGEFTLTARDPFDSMDVKVESRGLANKTFSGLPSGINLSTLKMSEGTTVTGRVVLNGRPLKGISVGIVSIDRGMENFTGDFEIATGADGRFAFVNMPPNVNYDVYGLMSSLKNVGAIPGQEVRSGGDGKTTDVGDLKVGPGYRLAGRVELSDGKQVPPKTRLLIGREKAWDAMQVLLDETGAFDTTGIPAGGVTLSVRVNGYSVSPKNTSIDRLNPFMLAGQITGDTTNLVFLLEKGKGLEPDYGQSIPESSRPQNRPLHGIENGVDHSQDWALSGVVTDAETHDPIGNFHVIPGSAQPWGRMEWDKLHAVEGTNGNFTAYLDKHWNQPLVEIKADGYLPLRITLLPLQKDALKVALKRGTGPSGIVLLPDGKPAANHEVMMICEDDQNVGVGYGGKLNAYYHKERIVKTDGIGHFSFPPEAGMQLIVTADEEAFKAVAVESLKTNATIQLEPYGQIVGELKRPSGPGTNEMLDLAFRGDSNPLFPRIQLNISSKTDNEGRFKFDKVPAGEIEITYRQIMQRPPMESWQNKPLMPVLVKPGETMEAHIKAGEIEKGPQVDKQQLPGGEPVEHGLGQRLKGRVVLSDRRPAVNAQVALRVRNKYLALGKARLTTGGNPEEGRLITTDSNGAFTLPLFTEAIEIIAVSEDGIAQVSMDEFKKSSEIKLKPWGRIEGVLHIGENVATNASVLVGPEMLIPDEIIYDFSEFQALTDDHGRFVITYVPPGPRKIWLLVPMGPGSRAHQQLAVVDVKPGEATKVTLGGDGRNVTAKLRIVETPEPIDWKTARAFIQAPYPQSAKKLMDFKTTDERLAYMQTEEYKASQRKQMQESRSYPVALTDDGMLTGTDIPPGKYELRIVQANSGSVTPFSEGGMMGKAEVSIPAKSPGGGERNVDLGTIDVKLATFGQPAKEK